MATQLCPCGHLSDPDGTCTCPDSHIRAYRAKLSGPLLDRMDLQVEVPRVEFKELLDQTQTETSEQVRCRVERVKQIQQKRFQSTPLFSNARMGTREIQQYCRLDSEGERLLERASGTLKLSARACHSLLKTARTIADLDSSDHIHPHHMGEALQYRGFDRYLGRHHQD